MYRLILFTIGLALASTSWAQSALTVQAVSPTIQQVVDEQEVSGYINAYETATVNARLNGVTLEEIYVDIGDFVEEGDLLVRFDDTLIEHELSQAKAQRQQSEVALAQSSDNAARAQILLQESAMSRLEGERYLSSKQNAQAQLDFAKAQVAMQELRLSYANVHAPVSGIVSEKSAMIGQTSAVGQPLITLIVDGQLEWQAKVASDNLARIEKDMPVTVWLPNDKQVKGRVYKIAPTVDQQTRQGTVYVLLDPHPDLRAGLFVRGKFNLGRRQAMTIPSSTVMREDGYTYVWLIDESSHVRKQAVTTLDRQGDEVVVSGLSPDARLVARGGGFLVDGDLVKVVDMREAAGTADEQAPL